MSRFSRLTPIVLMVLGGLFAAGGAAIAQGVPAPAVVPAPAGATRQAAAPEAQAGRQERSLGPRRRRPRPALRPKQARAFR